MLGTSLAYLAACALTNASAPPATGHDVYGDWYTPDRDSVVRIADCGDGTPCGTVTWQDPERAKVVIDRRNEDQALRGRPIVGITLLGGFEAAEEDWRRGAIYNPENGATYRARLKRLDADRLQVKGCVGPICKGMVWERRPPASADVQE